MVCNSYGTYNLGYQQIKWLSAGHAVVYQLQLHGVWSLFFFLPYVGLLNVHMMDGPQSWIIQWYSGFQFFFPYLAVRTRKMCWLQLHLYTWSTRNMRSTPQSLPLWTHEFCFLVLQVCGYFLLNLIFTAHCEALVVEIPKIELPFLSLIHFVGSEIYQEMLANALANYFGAKLLIFDSHSFLGVRDNFLIKCQ